MKYSYCLLQWKRWNCVRLSFPSTEWCAKGLGVWSWLQAGLYLITLSPAEQRFEPWPPEFPVGAIASGHHSLKASPFHSTDLKKIPWFNKIEVLAFSHLEQESVPKTFPAFSNCITSPIKSYIFSFRIFCPLTIEPLVVLPWGNKTEKQTTHSPIVPASTKRQNSSKLHVHKSTRTWVCKQSIHL